MDLKLIEDFLQVITSEPRTAIILILALVIYWLLKDRTKLVEKLDARDAQVLQIVKQYQKGSLDLAKAMGKIGEVLSSMRERL